MGLRLGENTTYYLVVTFSITYLKVHVHANTKGETKGVDLTAIDLADAQRLPVAAGLVGSAPAEYG